MSERRRAKLGGGRSELSAAEGGTSSGRRPMARRHTVAAIVFDGIAPFELSVACEVFGIDRSDLGVPWYKFFVCAAEESPVQTSVGFTIDTPYRLEDLRKADTIVVPARSHGALEFSPAL